ITAACCDKILEPPFNFCVAKRRSLHLYYITENQLGTTKEIPLPDGAIILKKCGKTILAADGQTYKLVSERSGAVTPLFPYDRTLMKPIICSIGKTEFLLAFATAQMIGLGMFVNSNGDAVRGTLQWSAIPKSIVFQFPYIIALLRNNTLEVHNLFTQELVSTIEIPSHYNDPRTLYESSFPLALKSAPAAAGNDTSTTYSAGVLKVLIVCRDCVLAVKMKGLDAQITDLLDSRQVNKAIQLAEYAVQWGETENTKKQVFDRIYEQAGIAYFKDLAFDESLKCFQKGEVDPMVLLNQFGGVVAACADASGRDRERIGGMVSWNENVEAALLEGVKKRNPGALDDEKQISQLLKDTIQKAKDTLTTYFLSARNKVYALHAFEEIDNFLLVVYEQSGSAPLNAFLSVPNYCNVSKAEEFLWNQERFYALSLLLKSTSQTKKVLEIWLRFISGEYEDEEFEGSASVVAYLAEVTDKTIFLEYAQRLLVVDPSLGVQVFINAKLEFQKSEILAILSQYGNPTVFAYLENQRERGRTDAVCDERLLKLYFEEVKRLYNRESLLEIREFFTFLYSVWLKPKFGRRHVYFGCSVYNATCLRRLFKNSARCTE
ncbi:UNVERIFIED_CONTAM: transforming growth factor, beta receptor associated protein 1, partial [Siphonaria sp. JEL0065]